MKRKLPVVLIAIAMALTLATPAFAAGSATPLRSGSSNVTIFGAASLNRVFPALVKAFKVAHPRYKDRKFVYNFQGTDTLVSQIEQGATPDIFAGASTKYGNTLYNDGFIVTPVSFCQNVLTVITPIADTAAPADLGALADSGVMIAIGNASVPVGTYTRTVLNNLSNSADPYDAPYGTDYGTKVLANAVAQLPNVSGVVLLVATNNVDAGFCYQSDYWYARAKVKQIVIPDTYQSVPKPTYPIARLKSAAHPVIAQKLINFILGKTGQKILKSYQFLPKPAAS